MRIALPLALAGAVAVAAAAAHAGGAARGIPTGFRPETAAAVGTRNYWVIGEYKCPARVWCLALVRSTDSGGHFTRVALPPLPSQGTEATLEFANARVGFVFVPGSRLYVTRDGGSSWHPFGSAHVREVALGGGDVYALSRNRFERSPLSQSSLHPVALPVDLRFVVSLSARGRRVWLLGSTRHIRAGDVTLRSADRGATFVRSKGPCFPELGGKLVPAGQGRVWAVCPSGMMAGLSLSTNGGRTFPRFRSFHDPGGLNLPALTNGAAIVPESPRAAVLYEGASGPLYRTTDTGKRWARLPRTARFEQAYWLSLATSRVGGALFTTRSHPNRASFWRTTDGGATWHSVAIH